MTFCHGHGSSAQLERTLHIRLWVLLSKVGKAATANCQWVGVLVHLMIRVWHLNHTASCCQCGSWCSNSLWASQAVCNLILCPGGQQFWPRARTHGFGAIPSDLGHINQYLLQQLTWWLDLWSGTLMPCEITHSLALLSWVKEQVFCHCSLQPRSES